MGTNTYMHTVHSTLQDTIVHYSQNGKIQDAIHTSTLQRYKHTAHYKIQEYIYAHSTQYTTRYNSTLKPKWKNTRCNAHKYSTTLQAYRHYKIQEYIYAHSTQYTTIYNSTLQPK